MFVCPECGAGAPSPGFCTDDGAALANADDPMLGRTIGSYRVARLLGAGGMGRVYLGVHPGIGSRVAIKVMMPGPAATQSSIERFFAEARAVNVIRNEHIVNIINLEVLPEGQPYIVMEYLDGRPLSELIRSNGPLPLGSVVRLVSEVLDALAHAHDKGIVHRDLKPDNIIVSPSGHAKVLDFGVAKLKPEIAQVSGGTRSGALLGTPHYMSPEQARGQTVDARSDLYSVGVVLYECVLGRKPFESEVLYELLRQHIEQRPAPLSTSRSDVPPPLESVILGALEKEPHRRFQSAREMAAALQHAAATLPPESYAPLASTLASAAPPLTTAGTQPPATPAAVVPTGAGYANTIQPVLPSATPTARGSSLPWLVAGGLGALLVATVILAGAFLLVGRKPARAPGSAITVPRGTVTVSPVLPPFPTVTGTTATRTPRGVFQAKPPGFDSRHFDVWGYFPTAQSLARSHWADAALVRLDITGVDSAGFVDFTADTTPRPSVLYRFRSPSRSTPPAGVSARGFKSDCRVYVTANESGISDYVADNWSCEEPIVGRPRCSPVQIWQRARSRGAPSQVATGNLGFWAGPGNRGRWLATLGKLSQWVPDDC
jgi:serine/threonine protein kinase